MKSRKKQFPLLPLLPLLIIAVSIPLFVVALVTNKFEIRSRAADGTYYCSGCSRSYDKTFARWTSTTADCESGIVEGSQIYTPSCACSAPGEPPYSTSAEYKCDVAPYACSGCTEYKKMSGKVFAIWQSIYADCSVKKGSVRYSKDPYCAGSTRTPVPVDTTSPPEGSVTIATNITLSTPTFKSKFSPIAIKKSGNQLSVRMRVPSYSNYNFFANIYLFAYPRDPIFHVPVKQRQAFVKLSGISDGQYHEYQLPFNASLSLLQVEEIYVVFSNIPRVPCANNSRENPCYLPMDIDYIRI